VNNSWRRIKTCGKYSGLPFLAEITSRIFFVDGEKYKKKIEIFAQIFCARVKQIRRFVYANVSAGFNIHEVYMRFVCSEIENFPQRFPTIPTIKSMIFNCNNLSRHLLRVMFRFYKRIKQWLKKAMLFSVN